MEWLMYSVWVSIWILFLLIAFVVWGRRLRSILAPLGPQTRASVATISWLMTGLAIVFLTTVMVLLIATVAGFYWIPWPWLIASGINRIQEVAGCALLITALYQTKNDINQKIAETAEPFIASVGFEPTGTASSRTPAVSVVTSASAVTNPDETH